MKINIWNDSINHYFISFGDINGINCTDCPKLTRKAYGSQTTPPIVSNEKKSENHVISPF